MYWVSLKPSRADAKKLHQLRERAISQVDSSIYDEEETPHITIIPGFTVEEEISEEDLFDDLSLPITLEFSSYHIWPSTENPMVVAVDPRDTTVLQQIRDAVQEPITDNGTLEYEPKPFHLTLFKGGDAGDEHSFSAPDASIQEIEKLEETGHHLPVTVEFDTIELLSWDV